MNLKDGKSVFVDLFGRFGWSKKNPEPAPNHSVEDEFERLADDARSK